MEFNEEGAIIPINCKPYREDVVEFSDQQILDHLNKTLVIRIKELDSAHKAHQIAIRNLDICKKAIAEWTKSIK